MSTPAVHEYGPYTLYDLDALPEDGKRYELADGWLTELPGAPRTPTSCTLGRSWGPMAEMFWLPERSIWLAIIMMWRRPDHTTSNTLR